MAMTQAGPWRPQAESFRFEGEVGDYVRRQWQELNKEFQSCCVALETFDVHVWVERNVTVESATGAWTQPQINETHKMLICGFYARRLGNDMFWKRAYCRPYQSMMSRFQLIEMAGAEEAVAGAQEASTEAMIASPWYEPGFGPDDPPTPPPQPVVPTGFVVSQIACSAALGFQLWMQEEIMPRQQAWMDLISGVVRCLAEQLLGPDGILSMQTFRSLAALDTDFVLFVELSRPARFCCEDILMHIMLHIANLRLPT
jgi:hypothetical protein